MSVTASPTTLPRAKDGRGRARTGLSTSVDGDTPSTAQAGSPGGVSVSGLLRALQQENDSLRSQLLQSQQSTHHLSRQLEDALATLKEASDAQKDGPLRETVHALQTRCQTLAERLLAVVQGRQGSQSAEVLFLLRSQQEERLFLTDALEDMLSELRGCSREAVHAQAQDPPSMAADVDGSPSVAGGLFTDAAVGGGSGSGGGGGDERAVGLHAGTVYRLMTLVADEMRQQRAQRKLDAARARMALEHVQDVLADVQEATERATRSIFQSWSALARGVVDSDEVAPIAASVSGGARADRSSWGSSHLSAASSALPAARAPPLSGGASSLHTPLPYRRTPRAALPLARPAQEGPRRYHGYTSEEDEADLAHAAEEDEDDQAVDPSFLLNGTTATSSARLFPVLEEELAWASDVLKACYRGLGDAQQCTVDACTALGAVVGRAPPTATETRAYGLPANTLAPISGVSEEADRLLHGFLADLRTLAHKAAHQQEGLARRLSVEMQQQYFTAHQHEARVRVLEAENAKLTAIWNRLTTELETRTVVSTVADGTRRSQRAADSPLTVTPERAVAGALFEDAAEVAVPAALPAASAPAVAPRAFAFRPSAATQLAHGADESAVRRPDRPSVLQGGHLYGQSVETPPPAPASASAPARATADRAHRALQYGEDEAARPRAADRRPRHAQTPAHAVAKPQRWREDSLSSLDDGGLADEHDASLSESAADLWVQPSPKAAQRRAAPPAASVDGTSPYRSERSRPSRQPLAPARASSPRRAATTTIVSPPSPPPPPSRVPRTGPSSHATARTSAVFEQAVRTPVSPVIAEVDNVPPRSAAVNQLWKSLQTRSRPSSPSAVSTTATPRTSPRRGRAPLSSSSGLVSPRRERLSSPRQRAAEAADGPRTPRSWRSVRGTAMSSPTRD